MASIQCSIELYDGVTPTLASMTAGLDNLIGRFQAFDSMGSELNLLADTGGLMQAVGAIGAVAEEARGAQVSISGMGMAISEVALGAVHIQTAFGALQASAAGMSTSLNMAFDMMPIMNMASGVLLLQSSMMSLAQTTAMVSVTMTQSFMTANESIVQAFTSASSRINAIMLSMGSYIRSVANSIPSYFSGPLASVAGMFSSMAASARASLASIGSAARSAASSVSASVSSMSASVSKANSLSFSGISGKMSLATTSSLSSFQVMDKGRLSTMETISDDSYSMDRLNPDTAQLSGTGQTIINVEMNNQNHISKEADVDAVIAEFEERLTEAVLTSAEGIH